MSPSLSRLLPLVLLGGALGVAACKRDKADDTGPTAGAGAACAWEAAGVLDGTLGRALVRLGNGQFVRVQVGSDLDGGQVTAIGENALNYVKRGTTYALQIPQG